VPELFAGTTDPNLQRNNGSSDENARQNYFGQISYDYKGKYLFQGHLRRDASERFASSERVGYFPGLSAGWLVTRENFFNVPAIDYLKIRASWGILGNDAIGRFNYLSLFNFAPGYVFNGSIVAGGISEGTLAARNTTWEKKETQNIGFEIGILKNRKLTLEFDYFKNITSDILITRNATVSDVSGIASLLPRENLGEFENKGIEILATYRENINDFNLNISGNFTSTRNKTIFIDEPEPIEGREHLSREGKPWGTPLIYVVEGRFLSKTDLDDPNKLGLGNPKLGDWIYKDINNDGVINANDRIISDYNTVPRVTAGLNVNAEFKGIDLTINTYAQARIRKLTHFYIAGETTNTPAYYFNNLYYSPEELGTIPALNRGRDMNTFYERNASFIRIQTIELGYSLPSKTINKIGLNGVRFYLNGNNMFTFSKFKNLDLGDPETFNSGDFRFENSFRTITTGLDISF
jgi:TonB-linked SusC/RagA family outer membrane protein